MAIVAVIEPLVIVSLLAGGTLFNRERFYTWSPSSSSPSHFRRPEPWQDIEYGASSSEIDSMMKKKQKRSDSVSSSSTIWHDVPDGTVMEGGMDPSASQWRHRTLRVGRWEREVTVPNTEVHKGRLLSRVLKKYPFLVEVWYWALIYWVCWTTYASLDFSVLWLTIRLKRSTNLGVPSQPSHSKLRLSTRPASMHCRSYTLSNGWEFSSRLRSSSGS